MKTNMFSISLFFKNYYDAIGYCYLEVTKKKKKDKNEKSFVFQKNEKNVEPLKK